MAKKKTTRKAEKTELERHEEYVEFLKKRVFSDNYKNNVDIEMNTTKQKQNTIKQN